MNRELFALWALCASVAALVVVGNSHGAELPCENPESRTLAVLCGMPVHFMDEREEEPAPKRQLRLRTIARGIEKAAQDPIDRAALIVLARRESGLAAYVYENRCGDGPRGKYECDFGKATGPFQLHTNNNYPEIPDSIKTQASIAAGIWRYGRSSCRHVAKDELASAFASYGSGGKCAVSKSSQSRADELRRIVRRLS